MPYGQICSGDDNFLEDVRGKVGKRKADVRRQPNIGICRPLAVNRQRLPVRVASIDVAARWLLPK
jgi:hypothetical protein